MLGCGPIAQAAHFERCTKAANATLYAICDVADDLRWQYLQYGWQVAKASLPWGSGAGSFREVYAPFEPVGVMREVHALHAHNDLLQSAEGLDSIAPAISGA